MQSYQGMDFLEGLSKKKQQNHHNYHRHNQNFQHQQQQYLKTGTINPLTAQSSLNIHLHGIIIYVNFDFKKLFICQQ